MCWFESSSGHKAPSKEGALHLFMVPFSDLHIFRQLRPVKFLVIQTAFIGDVILATAVIEKLHQSHPSAKIDFLVRKGNEGLLTNHPFINQVLIWNKKEQKIRNLFKLVLQVRKEKYDVVVNLHRFASSGLITALSNATKTVGYKKNPLSFLFNESFDHTLGKAGEKYLHETDRNQMLIRSLTDEEKAAPRLYPQSSDFDKVLSLKSKPYVCIAPASVWYTKQWIIEKWVELIQKLPTEYQVFLLGAPSDRSLCEQIVQQAGRAEVQSLCGQLSFLESAALIKDARMNYVNDSAPLHIASAMNAPVTAVFCSTIPEFGFGPLSQQSFIIETKEKLPCRPCGLHGKKDCPLHHFNCAATIETNEVLSTLTHSH